MDGLFRWESESWGPALRCAALESLVPHLFTSRALALGAAGPEGEAAWAALAGSFACRPSDVVRLKQVHGTEIVVRRAEHAASGSLERQPREVHDRDDSGDRPAADIVVSNDPSLVLAVQAADCVPLLLADRRSGAVAAVHAGWRGTAAGAAVVAVHALRSHFDARARDLVAAIGPSIGPCCYEVGPELRDAFLEAGHQRDEVDRWFQPSGRLDLWAANRDQLVRAGIPADAVHVARLCTRDDAARLCSYRRDGAAAGRMAAAIRAR
jgi:YfiH family protein